MRLVWLMLALLGCSAPDYTPVRDWSAAAGLAVDQPGGEEDAAQAIQEVLAVYFAALGTLATDGVLPHREDPFAALAPRAGRVDAAAGQNIASLGTLLRRASRGNYQAPELRNTITAADPLVQAIMAALLPMVARPAGPEAAARAERAATYATLAQAAPDLATRQSILEWAALRDREAALQAQARADRGALIAQVAADHAMLRARAPRINGEEAVQDIRAAEDRLRRANARRQRGLPAQ